MTNEAAHIPKAAQRWLTEFEETPEYLRTYVSEQGRIYAQIRDKPTDLLGWLCLKLSCGRTEARVIYRWVTGERI